MTNMLIALHGAQGAGKDAVAEILVRVYGFTRFAFADRLKQMCEALNPIVTYRVDSRTIAEFSKTTGLDFEEMRLNVPTLQPVRLLEVVSAHGWDEAKRRYPEVRRTQQYLATEVVRDFVSPNFWVDEVNRDMRGCRLAVITDLRFESEYAMVQRMGGRVWWVTREDNPYPTAAVDTTHRSETWHPDQYISITNDGTLVDLADQVHKVLGN